MLHDYWLDVLDITCSFFFKQKTAYELRISYWSSDVCSSDLVVASPAPSSSSSLSRNQSAAAGTSSRVNSPTSSARSAPWRTTPLSARRPDNRPRASTSNDLTAPVSTELTVRPGAKASSAAVTTGQCLRERCAGSWGQGERRGGGGRGGGGG